MTPSSGHGAELPYLKYQMSKYRQQAIPKAENLEFELPRQDSMERMPWKEGGLEDIPILPRNLESTRP